MIAIIPAAGDGTRMKELGETPKGLMKIGKETILERIVRLCNKKGIHKVVIIIGYEEHIMRKFIVQTFWKMVVEYNCYIVLNKHWKWTNNMYSLWLAREYIENNDLLIINSDTVFRKEAIETLIATKGNYCIGVNGPYTSIDKINVKILYNPNTECINFIGKENVPPIKNRVLYESADLVKVKKEFVPMLLDHMGDAILEIDPSLSRFEFEQYMINIAEKLQLVNIKENSRGFNTPEEYKKVIKIFT